MANENAKDGSLSRIRQGKRGPHTKEHGPQEVSADPSETSVDSWLRILPARIS